jgi:hypothetical protein
MPEQDMAGVLPDRLARIVTMLDCVIEEWIAIRLRRIGGAGIVVEHLKNPD